MLLPKGHLLLSFQSAPLAKDFVVKKDWKALDQLAKSWLEPQGPLFELLQKYCEFQQVEHILALRQAPDDEGIWHDDGSRKLAFSLSLTLDNSSVEGGELSIRAKSSDEISTLTCRPYGELVLFNTGKDGFEHKISAVRAGQRLVLAGWCS